MFLRKVQVKVNCTYIYMYVYTAYYGSIAYQPADKKS